MRAYVEHSVFCAVVRPDQCPREYAAILGLVPFKESGDLELVASSVTRGEFEQAPPQHQEPFKAIYSLLPLVADIPDHELLGFNSNGVPARLGWICSPMIEDNPTASELWKIGLTRIDAHHVLVAIHNRCDVFLTRDQKSILKFRNEIESRFPIRLRLPSELLAELSQRAPVCAGPPQPG